MERAIKEKMSIHQEMQTTMPRDLINAKPVTAAVREFFGSSQLSQFMDQTNPLSEITHKRRLSALGPGGLSRERAGFEVRDVHPTHYGRICPIETPEGPNIGLISSLSCFARLNGYGFIQSPYRKVMGSNLQRRAMPLIRGEARLVGPCMERVTARDSGAVVLCKREGIVDQVDSERIIVRVESDHSGVLSREVGADIYQLIKFKRSNQNTCISQKPLVRVGDRVKKAQGLAAGPCTVLVPPGNRGTTGECKIFPRKGGEKDEPHKAIEATQVFKLEKNLADEIRILTDERLKRLTDLLGNKILQADLHDEKTNKRLLTKGVELTRDIIEKISTRNLKRLKLNEKDPLLIEKIEEIEEMTSRQIDVLRKITEERKEKLKKGDELPPGVIKLVKVYIAMKRKLSIGDKMAGRHGNKGVIARIVPQEDMPYLPDGTPVEIVLNPLGVPSRMNVGQILETHLGWASKELGNSLKRLLSKEVRAEALRRWFREVFGDTAIWKSLAKLSDDDLLEYAEGFREGIPFATPVFDGAREPEIRHLLEVAGLPNNGKINLFDGMTGDQFDQPVTVGFIYMLKLSHLVDDKIHARSIGPYSLITQQPLGGKAQFGGQRFGEMEVWALEAYGAAHILQELLTAKCDDVYGRAKIYEAIVKGEPGIEPGVPESFNVLVRELQSLCLDVELMKRQKPAEKAAD